MCHFFVLKHSRFSIFFSRSFDVGIATIGPYFLIFVPISRRVSFILIGNKSWQLGDYFKLDLIFFRFLVELSMENFKLLSLSNLFSSR